FPDQVARLRLAIAGETGDCAAGLVGAMTRKNDHVQVINVIEIGPCDEIINRRNDSVGKFDLVTELCEELQLSSRRVPGEESIFSNRLPIGLDHPAWALLD